MSEQKNPTENQKINEEEKIQSHEDIETDLLKGKEISIKIKETADTYANTSPLGLIAFGMTTVMLSFHNVSAYEMNTMIIGMGFFYGGIAQLIAGIFEIKKSHTFGGTAFCSYGAFWLSFCCINFGNKLFGIENPDKYALGTFLLFWFIFTGFMFFGTLKHGHLTLKMIFGSLAITFLFLSIGAYTEKKAITKIGGYIGLLCGGCAIYTACAEIIDGEQGYTLMPI